MAVILTTSLNIAIEVLPLHLRCFVMNSIWAGFFVSQGLNFIYLEVFNSRFLGLKKYLISGSTTMLAIAFLIFVILVDTPRDLILNNEEFKGVQIVSDLCEDFLKFSPSKTQMHWIIHDLKKSQNEKMIKGSFCDLYNEKYLRTTILMTTLFSSLGCIYYGILMTTPLFIKKLQIESNFDTFYNMLIFSILPALGSMVMGAMCEFPLLKRRLSIILCFSFAAICSLVIIFDFRYANLWANLFYALLSMGFSASMIYVSELYHTKIRDIAVGSVYSYVRFFSCASVFIYFGLFSFNIFSIWIANIFFLVIMISSLILLEKDSYGHALDS